MCVLTMLSCFLFFSQTLVAKVTVDSITVDTESFKDNPLGTFEFVINTTSDSNAESAAKGKIHATYNIFSLKGGMDLWNFQNKVWEVSGPNSHRQHFTHNAESLEGHEGGMFACSGITISDNVQVDSYDSSLGYYAEGQQHNNAQISCNSLINLEDNSTILGNISAEKIIQNTASFIYGTASEEKRNWSCFEDYTSEVRAIVSLENNNDTIDLENQTNSSYSSNNDFYLSLNANETLVLKSGIYYLQELSLSNGAKLEISGPVMIFCDGPVFIGGNSIINSHHIAKDLAIHYLGTEHQINISGKAQVTAEIFAVNGTINVSESAEVYGNVKANEISLEGNSLLHIDSKDNSKQLSFAIVEVFDENHTPIGKEITLFKTNPLPEYFELDVVNGHFNKILYKLQQGGPPIKINVTIKLKGYSDYQLLWDADLFEQIIANLPLNETNIFTLMLQFEENNTIKKLNFHRAWIYHWSNDANEFIRYKDLSGNCVYEYDELGNPKPNEKYNPEPHNQPWKYLGSYWEGNECDRHYKYDMLTKQPCDGPDNYRCFWNRLRRLCNNAWQFGAVIELDFFDHAVMKQVADWWHHPFNPLAVDGQTFANELLPYNPPGGLPSWPSGIWDWYDVDNSPNLKAQQKKLVQWIVGETARFANVFYVPMNEPLYRGNSENDQYGAAYWHDKIIQWVDAAYVTENEVPPGNLFNAIGPMLIGLNIYIHPEAPPITHNHEDQQDSCEWLVSKMSQKNKVKIISFHTPYYKLSGPPSCNERIDALKEWFRGYGDFSGKAMIIDTDGDLSGGCRDYDTPLHDWALETYSDHGHGTADFITKSPTEDLLYPPDENKLKAIIHAWEEAQ